MNADSFKQQFLPYHRKLYRVAFLLTRNSLDAEDLVQEAYLKLWRKRNDLPTDINRWEAYCITLLKNLYYDSQRVSHLEENGKTPDELQLLSEHNVAKEIEQRDEMNQIRKLIELLPEQQRKVIRMRDIDDRPYEEIEQTTGLSAIHIRVLLSRARKKIREQFKEIANYEKI